MESKLYQLNKEDGLKILKVFGYTVATSVIVALMDIIKVVDMPAQYLWVVPLINTLLVTAKDFLTNSDGQFGRAER